MVPAWDVITVTGGQEVTWTAASSGGSDTYQSMLIGLKIATTSLDVSLQGSWDSGHSSAGVTQKSVVRNSAVSAGDVVIVCVLGNVGAQRRGHGTAEGCGSVSPVAVRQR